VEAIQRIDRFKALRAKVIADIFRIIGEKQPADAKDALPDGARLKAEVKISVLKGGLAFAEADELRAKLRAIESYDAIIKDNLSHPPKDVKIAGLPLANPPSYSIDFDRIRATLAGPDFDPSRPQGGIRFEGEAASSYAVASFEKKRPLHD
jgi:hypothetical protein